jgi:hypothetical protein
MKSNFLLIDDYKDIENNSQTYVNMIENNEVDYFKFKKPPLVLILNNVKITNPFDFYAFRDVKKIIVKDSKINISLFTIGFATSSPTKDAKDWLNVSFINCEFNIRKIQLEYIYECVFDKCKFEIESETSVGFRKSYQTNKERDLFSLIKKNYIGTKKVEVKNSIFSFKDPTIITIDFEKKKDSEEYKFLFESKKFENCKFKNVKEIKIISPSDFGWVSKSITAIEAFNLIFTNEKEFFERMEKLKQRFNDIFGNIPFKFELKIKNKFDEFYQNIFNNFEDFKNLDMDLLFAGLNFINFFIED